MTGGADWQGLTTIIESKHMLSLPQLCTAVFLAPRLS